MKQTNNAIKFLMAQYRAIFKNANMAMLAAIAASALAAGQAQANPITDWTALTGSPEVSTGSELTVSGDGSKGDIVNEKGFDVVIKSGTNTIKSATKAAHFTVKEGVSSSITLATEGAADQTTLTIGTGTQNETAKVTIGSFTNTKGTLVIQGSGAGADASALNAKVINLGVDSAAADDAVVTVKGHGSLNATGTGEGEGLLIGKGAKLTIEASGTATGSKIAMTDGKVLFSGTVTDAILGSDTSVIDITGGTITNETDKGGGIKGATINLGGEGKIEAAHNINITAGDGGFNVQGGTINVATAKKVAVTGNTTISAGTVTVSGHATSGAGALEVTGALTLNGENAKIVLSPEANGGKLTVSGTTTATAGNLSLGSGSVATFNGDASFAEGTLTAVKGSKIDLGTITANQTRTLTVSSKDIKTMLTGTDAIKGSGSSADTDTFVIKFNDADTEVLDLSSKVLGIIGNDTDGSVTDKISLTTAKLKIAGNSAKFLGSKFSGATAYDFKKIEVGSGSAGEETFALEDGANLSVRQSISGKDGGPLKTLTVTKGTLTLAGEQGVDGSVEASTVVLSGSAANEANLKVTGGQWSVADLTLTKGTAIVESTKDDGLDVAGTLTLTKDSTLTVKGGYVSTIGNGKVNFKDAAANGVKLTNGTLKFDGEDVLKDNKLSTDAIKGGSISGDGASVIVIDNAKAAITQAKFEQLKKDLGTAYTGSFEMNVTLDPITGDLNKDNIVTGLKTDAYNDLTYNAGATETVSGTLSVGNIKKDAETDIKLDAGGNLILNNASANKGAGNFVTINSGSGTTTGGVIFGDENNTLSLGGSGKIASITAETTKHGTVNIGVQGNEYKAGHLTVVAGNSIGSSTASIKSLSLGDKSSLVVESGDVYTAEFAAKAGTSVDVKGGINAEKFSFNGDSLTATSLTLSGSAKDNTIAGGANVALDTLTMGANAALLVGEAGQPAQAGKAGETADLGSNAVVYTKSLKMDTTSSIFVDPNYGTGASLFATENIGDNGSTVSGKVGIGSNSAFGVGFDSMAAFQDVVGDYLTVNGGFDENGVKNALVINKGISVASGNGIAVDAALTSGDYATKAQADTLTLGEGAALVLTDKAFGADKKEAAIKFASTTSGSITAGAKSKVVLLGEFDANDLALKLGVYNTDKAATVNGNL